jgi:hypothetical protein
MKTSEVKILLQKYYDGLTSLEEESRLEKYFLVGQADSELEADRLHFVAVSSMRDEDIQVPEDLEISVLNVLKEAQKKSMNGNRRMIYTVLSIAAALLLMVSTFIILSRNDRAGYVTDPKVAYAESRDALEMVSKLFNQGTSHLTGLNRINQAVEPLGKLNTLDKAANSLLELGKKQNEK